MTIAKPHLTTLVEIWSPKYGGTESGEHEVWLSRAKIHHSTGVIRIVFTKAKHLIGQRFCVRRDKVERCPLGTNGKIPVYKVPFSLLEPWETPEEVQQLANELFTEDRND